MGVTSLLFAVLLGASRIHAARQRLLPLPTPRTTSATSRQAIFGTGARMSMAPGDGLRLTSARRLQQNYDRELLVTRVLKLRGTERRVGLSKRTAVASVGSFSFLPPAGSMALGASDLEPAAFNGLVQPILFLCLLIGLTHTSFKLIDSWSQARRMHRMLSDTPTAQYADPGNLLGFTKGFVQNRTRLHDWMNEITLGLPVSKMVGIPFDPAQVLIIVRDPICIKHFLNDAHKLYSKPADGTSAMFYFLTEWIGQSVFTAQHGVGAADNGCAWRTQRKMCSNVLAKAEFRSNMSDVFTATSLTLAELLRSSAEKGQAVDLQHMFFSFTMDSIMRIFFGVESQTMEGVDCAYAESFDIAHRSVMEYIHDAAIPLSFLNYLPGPLGGFRGIAWKLHGSVHPKYREHCRARQVLFEESERIISACRQDPELQQRKDLLALYIKSAEKDDFSNDYLRDMVMSIVLASRDTTSCLLSWMFHVLSTNPDVEKKLLAEIDSILPMGSPPTREAVDASTMPYLNGVIYETLRIHPPVPLEAKIAHADDVLPNGTKVPKGANLVFLPYAMGRDAALYTDPEAVRPERWIPFTPPAPHEFPVFQAGPRMCMGVDFAVFETKVVAVTLLQRYRFELLAGEAEKIHYSPNLTMSVCNSKQQDSDNLWMVPRTRV